MSEVVVLFRAPFLFSIWPFCFVFYLATKKQKQKGQIGKIKVAQKRTTTSDIYDLADRVPYV